MSGKTTFTQAMADKICDRLATGESLLSICRSKSYPAVRTVQKWLKDAVSEGFSHDYVRAREAGIESHIDGIIDISDDTSKDIIEYVDENGEVKQKGNSINVQRDRLRIDTRKWIASKIIHKKYGERITTESTHRVALSDLSEAELDRRLEELEHDIERSTED